MNKQYSKIILLFIGLITISCIFLIKQLHFNYEFENFFPKGDPDLAFYDKFRTLFENDNDYLLLAIENKEGIFKKSFLSKVDSLAHKIKRLEQVEHLLAPTDVKQPLITPTGPILFPVLHVNNPDRYPKDSTKIYQDPLLRNNLFAENGKSVAMVIKHTQMISKSEADQLVGNLEDLLKTYRFDDFHMAGKAQARSVYVSKMKWEFGLFFSSSVLLVILFLIWTFRSRYGVLMPLIVVLLAVCWVLGFMGLVNKDLDILMVLLPTIIFVVGVSDVVHLLSKYFEEIRAGTPKSQAIKTTIKEIGLATFLTSLTTSVGFITLLTSNVQPVRDFGIYTATGVLIAFFVSIIMIPAVLTLTKTKNFNIHGQPTKNWHKTLQKIFLLNLKNPGFVMASGVLIIGMAIIGISKININAYLIEDLPKDDPLKQNFLLFDKQYGGAKPFELAVMIKDTTQSIYDQQVLEELSKIQDYLIETYGVKNLISPVTQVKYLYKAMNSSIQDSFKLPEKASVYNRMDRYIQRSGKFGNPTPLTARDQTIGRFTGKIGDIGSKASMQKNNTLKEYINKNVDTTLIDYRITGTSHLIDKSNNFLTANMLEGLGIAFLVIALIAGIMFRSLRMVFITLIPNIIPLLMIAAVMGFFGINLKLSTSIIFTIAFGIAVDDTIHFISKLRLELGKGKSLLYALKRTYLTTGKAIIITSLILSGGFLTLILSDFGGTFYTGLLVSLTLIFAVLIDLSLLPVLVASFYKRKNKKRIKEKPIPTNALPSF